MSKLLREINERQLYGKITGFVLLLSIRLPTHISRYPSVYPSVHPTIHLILDVCIYIHTHTLYLVCICNGSHMESKCLIGHLQLLQLVL